MINNLAKKLKKPFYTNTKFSESNEWETSYAHRNETNLMLQSCLRVSYTSPKSMHWITQLLIWLNDDRNLSTLSKFKSKIEKSAIDPTRKYILENDFKSGVKTPHIVLNYLDYLLWKNSKGNFAFEYRNSIEHWYPQHPSEQSFDKWPDVDKFGNLCIIQHDINSKFSNLSPLSKKETYKKLIEKGSLKLRIMSDLTTSNTDWKGIVCDNHENAMIELLKDACKIE